MKKHILFMAACLMAVSIQAQKISIGTKLIAYYPFGADVNDYSGNSRNPSYYYNIALNQEGHNTSTGGALFEGSSSRITIPSANTWSDSLSISVWLKATTFENSFDPKKSGRHIVHKGVNTDYDRDYDLFTYTDSLTSHNKVCFWFGEDASHYLKLSSVANLNTNQWYHVVAVRANGNIKLYINGVLDTQTTYSFTPLDKGQPLSVGVSHASFQAFDGLLDELRIYKRAINECEISYLYDSTNFGTSKKLLAYYPLGSNLNDYSGNGLNATASANVTMNVTGFDGTANASSFNGTSSSVNIPSAWSQDLSIAVWIKANSFDQSPSSSTRSRHIIHKAINNGYARDYDLATYQSGGKNKVTFWFGESSTQYSTVDTKGSLNTNQWYHIAVTRANGVVKFYINGVADSSVTYSFTPLNKNHPAKIGVSHVAFQAFDGTLDELRIYGKELSVCEIQNLVINNSFRLAENEEATEELTTLGQGVSGLFPNPAQDIINVNTTETVESLEVYDFIGQRIPVIASGENNSVIDISTLTPGIYILKYTVAGESYSEKFVKN